MTPSPRSLPTMTKDQHMRRISGVATAAVLALTVVGMSPSVSDAAPSANPYGDSAGTTYRVTDTITDPNGATHVRMERFYQGLPVLGGDLVAHEGAQGALKGVSETLDNAIRLSTTPVVSKALAATQVVRDVKS